MVCPPAGEMLLAEFRKVLYWGRCYFLFMSTILILFLFSKICKFADDTKIVHAVAKEDEVQLFRDDLKNLAKWAIDCQMLFNVEKCVVMHIGTNNTLYSYDMNNATLKTVDVERDFGVIIIRIENIRSSV